MSSGLPLLSLAIWLPIVAGVVVMATGSDRSAQTARWLALIGAVLGFLVTLPLYAQFDTQAHGMQFQEMASWIARFHINYHLGIDGVSLLLILLNSFTTVLVVIAGWQVIETRVSQYMAAFLFLSGIMNGVFCALDGALFYVFFEATLIPMFIIIGVWGGPNRVYAAVKFFLYTLLGSLLTLVALIYLYNAAGGSFSLLDWYKLKIGMTPQVLVFLAFMLAFAVKVPMWPVHTWLPDAHVEAPTGGSVVLAAIMLKLGGYGFIRLSLPIVPDASHALAGFVIALSLIAVVYIGLVALVQTDMKKLIAYSSISHMGFVTMGSVPVQRLRVGRGRAADGLARLRVRARCSCAWACSTTACIRATIADYGGVVNTMPVFASFFMLFAMANAGLAGNQRVRGRVPRDPGGDEGELLVCGAGRDHAGVRRGLYSVDVQARGVRRGRQPRTWRS